MNFTIYSNSASDGHRDFRTVNLPVTGSSLGGKWRFACLWLYSFCCGIKYSRYTSSFSNHALLIRLSDVNHQSNSPPYHHVSLTAITDLTPHQTLSIKDRTVISRLRVIYNKLHKKGLCQVNLEEQLRYHAHQGICGTDTSKVLRPVLPHWSSQLAFEQLIQLVPHPAHTQTTSPVLRPGSAVAGGHILTGTFTSFNDPVPKFPCSFHPQPQTSAIP